MLKYKLTSGNGFAKLQFFVEWNWYFLVGLQFVSRADTPASERGGAHQCLFFTGQTERWLKGKGAKAACFRQWMNCGTADHVEDK